MSGAFDDARERVTLEVVKKLLASHKPATTLDLLKDCGFVLKFLNYGAFRNVFEIVGTPYAIKVPLQQAQGYTDHAHIEYNSYKRLMRLKKFESIRIYLPTIHAFVPKTGVTLVERYTELDTEDTRFDATIKQIETWLKNHGYSDPDSGTDKRENFGLDGFGRLKLLDLGCLAEGDC